MKALCLEALFKIELHPGGEYSLSLGGAGSAGYAWEFKVDGSPGVILVRQALPEPQPDVPPSALQTYSVEHTFIIEALGPGKVEVRFVLKRPWEKEVPPVQVKSVRVTVIK
jgi:predicted secreted protein